MMRARRRVIQMSAGVIVEQDLQLDFAQRLGPARDNWRLEMHAGTLQQIVKIDANVFAVAAHGCFVIDFHFASACLSRLCASKAPSILDCPARNSLTSLARSRPCSTSRAVRSSIT